jgi:pimeloyl-ACP methyl ester carboxylesterase
MPELPPLALVHAFPMDARMFDAVRSALDAAGPFITPDLRGFGAGPALGDPPPDPDIALYAADLAAELDARGIERAVVGGVSLGGYVALAFARRHPDRVAGMVLANTRSGADDEAARERRAGVAARADAGDIAAGADAIGPLVAPGAGDDVRARLAEIAGSVPAATVGWAQRAMAARPDSTAVLAGLRVPVLVVVGERDAITPPAAARQMVDTITEAGGTVDYVELPGVGHLTPAEEPDGFADAVLTWLGRRFAAGATAAR